MHVLFSRSSTVPCRREEKKQENISTYKDIHIRNTMVALEQRRGLDARGGASTTSSLYQRYVTSPARRWQKRHLVHTVYDTMVYAVDLIEHQRVVGKKVARLVACRSDHDNILRADSRTVSPPPKTLSTRLHLISPDHSSTVPQHPSRPCAQSSESQRTRQDD